MTDPRTRLKTKIVTYIDALTDERGAAITSRHSFSDGQEPLATLFLAQRQDLLVVYRWTGNRHPHHAASGIYAYTYLVDVGLACIDKLSRVKAQKLLASAIEEIEEVVREQSQGSSFVTSDSIRFENIRVGGTKLLFTCWLSMPVRSYIV